MRAARTKAELDGGAGGATLRSAHSKAASSEADNTGDQYAGQPCGQKTEGQEQMS